MIPEDKLAKFERGEIQMEAFSPDEQSELAKLVSGEHVEVEAPVEKTTVKEDAAKAAPVVEDKKDIPKDYVPGEKFKEKADEANTYKQKADTYSRQLEETRAQLEALRKQTEAKGEHKADANSIWSDQHQLDLVAEVARLRAIVETGVKGSQAKLEALEKELADKKKFAELNAFAAEFPELRLGRSFEEANEEYIQFTQKLGATPADLSAVDKYFQDANFRKEMEQKGIKAPKDYDRLEQILKVYHAKGNYPTYRAAYLDKFLSPTELQKRLDGQYLKGARETVDKIANNRNETATLDQGHNGESSLAMTEAQMMAWMDSHRYPATAQEKAIMAQIQSYIAAQSHG